MEQVTLSKQHDNDVEKAKNNTIEPPPQQEQVLVLKDTYNKIAYILHFFLGIGYLLPWNTFITAIDYFSYLYPSRHVERVFSVAYMTSSVLTLAVLILITSSRRRGPTMMMNVGLRVRLHVGFAVFVGSFMVAPAVAWTGWWARSPVGSFVVVVGSLVSCGVAEGLVAGSLIGEAGRLPKEYMQALFAGNGVAGVFVSVLRMITKASLPETPKGLQTSACFYFIVSATILLICMLSSNLLFILPSIQHHYTNKQQQTIRENTFEHSPKILTTGKQILWPILGIFSIYIVTLSIFPGFIADDNSQTSSKTLKDWYPIVLILAYNCSDLAGKSLTPLWIPHDVKVVTWACFGRVVFYPIFRVCLHGPRWMRTEVPMVFVTSMLGLSNGYLTSALMILTPKTVGLAEAETAAIVMTLALGLGLFGGSIIGWLWII